MPGADLDSLQRNLVTELRHKQVLNDAGVAQAFAAVPRHLFLPHIDPREAYQDQAISLMQDATGATISSASQPTMMAIMLEQLDLGAGMNVLEIGTATGFNAALIQQLVGPGGSVTSLEIDPDLSQRARNNLRSAGYDDVLVVNRDAAAGYAPRAPCDRIIATAGVWDLPAAWLYQLRDDGKLVAPIWLDGVQVSAAFTRTPDGSLHSHDNRPCAFVYLRGLAAGPRMRKRVGSSSIEILADDVDKIDTAALHLLLSQDQETHRLGANLKPEDYWFGFQIYLMLREPPRYVFAVYAIPDGDSYYGIEGNGILLFTPGSVAFAPYQAGGLARCFGGSSAFIKMQNRFDSWRADKLATIDRLRLRLLPKGESHSNVRRGKTFARQDHDLQVWLA